MILEFSDEADALDIAVIIFRNILSPFARLGKKSFTDVKMDGFFGDFRMFDQISYLQGFPGQVIISLSITICYT